MFKISVDNNDRLITKGKEIATAIELLFENRPSANDNIGVDNYYHELTNLTYKTIFTTESLEIAVAKKHIEYFNKLDVKSKEWLICKYSSTNTKRYGDAYAGELALLKNILEGLIKLLTEERMGMNTLLSKLKNR